MNNKSLLKNTLISSFLLLLFFGTAKAESFKFKFDSSKEISGVKYAIKDITPGLPQNWDGYNFVVIEFRITTPQRFHIGFNTDNGYNELRVMSYTPNGWNKLAIPLKFFLYEPGAAVDLAATYNQPRYTGWINLGGRRGPLHGVDSLGFRMRVPIGNPEIEVRSIALSKDDPGDKYLETIPAVDEFGQWNLGDYDGKIHSLEQLKNEWSAEDLDVTSNDAYNYSQYGGYKQKQVKATGFFRTEKIDGKWWFVDPEGYLFLSVGVDCVHAGGGGSARDVEKRDGMFKALPPESLRRGQRNPSFGYWNLYRRYGEDFYHKANENIINRMSRWGLNTIANWSSEDVIALNKKAFMLQLHGIGTNSELMGLADVYAPDYESKLAEGLKAFVSKYKDNPWLIGYFMGNEPSWLGREDYLCGLILKKEDNSPIKKALVEFLKSGDTSDKRKEFIINTFRVFMQTVNKTMKKYDPNHLNLGIRFGNIMSIDARILAICKESFDVLSFNCYDLCPDRKMLDRGMDLTGLPMIIGEYHFGTVDRGMAQSLWQVESQAERGIAYRYYTEQAYSHPGLVGTAYFQWCDQDLTGRNDGENYNCGIIDVTDRPYKLQVEAMIETAKLLYEVHSGVRDPFNQKLERARGHVGMPDTF